MPIEIHRDRNPRRRHPAGVALALLLPAACAPVIAGTPELALHADLFTGQNRAEGGGVQAAIGFDGRHVFVSSSREEGAELWVSDGTAGGTRLLADICPGKCSGRISGFSRIGNRLYFAADDGVHGRELWVLHQGSDTPQLVADINPGVEHSSPGPLQLVSLGAFSAPMFAATRRDVGRELFRLVGDSVVLDADIVPGPDSSSPGVPMPFGDATLLVVIRQADGRTVPRVLFYPPSANPPATAATLAGFPSVSSGFAVDPALLALGSNLVGLRRSGLGANVDQLWVAEPLSVRAFQGREGDLGEAVASGGLLYFNGIGQRELKVTNGFDAGTVIGPPNSRKLTAIPGGGVFFIGQNSASPTDLEVFFSRGTAGQTGLAQEIVPGSGGLDSSSLTDTLTVTSAGDSVYLARSEEIWLIGGTGGFRVATLPGLAAQFIQLELRPTLGRSVLFAGSGREPHLSDGVPGDVRKLAEVRGDAGHALVRPHARVGDRIVATAVVEDPGLEQIVAQPVDAAQPAQVLAAGRGFHPVSLGSRLLLQENTRRLMSTDGTAAGTTSFDVPRIVLQEGCHARFDDALLTVSELDRSPLASGVFHTDGTAAGSFNLVELEGADFAFPQCLALQRSFAVLGGQLFFTGSLDINAATREYELLRYDGDRVTQVANIDAGPGSSRPLHFAVLGDRVLFSADDGLRGRELWQTDGTAQGTRLLLDIVPGAQGSQPEQLRRVGDRVLFSARTAAEGRELWVTDGTAAGTQLLRDIAPGVASSIPDTDTASGLTISDVRLVQDVAGTRALVRAVAPPGSPDFGCPVFVSDGTAAGTRCAQDRDTPLPIAPLSPASAARFLPGGMVVFIGANQATGEEIRLLQRGVLLDLPGGDIRPGPRGSAPGFGGDPQQDNGLMVDGSQAWFAADDGVRGVELYRLDVSALVPPADVFHSGFED